MSTKKSSGPFNIIFIIILVVYILTFIIPSGSFERALDPNNRLVVDPTSFKIIPKVFVNPINVLFQIPIHAYRTMGQLFITMLIVGGTIRVVQDTDTLDLAIDSITKKVGSAALLVIPLILTFAGFLGTASVMISTVIAFIPLGITIAKRLKVDNIFAVALMFLGSYTGFMASPISPVTTAIAQELSGVPVFSGFEYRTLITAVLLIITMAYLTRYAYKVRQNIGNSVMTNITVEDLETNEDLKNKHFKIRNFLVLTIFLSGFLFFAYASYKLRYGVSHLAAIMIPVAITAGLVGGLSIDDLSKSFIKGAQGMTMPILFMVLSGSIAVILDQGKVMDSIVYYLSIPLNQFGSYFAVIGMFIFNSIVNLAIPSGSGQAVVVMPIMAPLADVVGISRQTAVLAYQMGDGYTNLLNPSNALLLGSLAYARCTLKDWFKLIMPLYIIFFIVLSIFLVIAVAMGWS